MLKKVRESKNLSQERLAGLVTGQGVKMNATDISLIEGRGTPPTADQKRALSEILGVHPTQLFPPNKG